MKGLPPALKYVLNSVKNHKYGAVATVCLYGHKHDSKKEAMWCVKLHELQKEGKISHLMREPLIPIFVREKLICNHLPDFFYFDIIRQKKCFCDVKGDWSGGKRPEWVIKRKLCEVLFPDHEYIVV